MRDREVLFRELAHPLTQPDALRLARSFASLSKIACMYIGGGLTWTWRFQFTSADPVYGRNSWSGWDHSFHISGIQRSCNHVVPSCVALRRVALALRRVALALRHIEERKAIKTETNRRTNVRKRGK